MKILLTVLLLGNLAFFCIDGSTVNLIAAVACGTVLILTED